MSWAKDDVSNWYGMYVKGEKVGYTQIVTKSVDDGYEVYELTNIELSMMGVKRGLKSISQYKVTNNFELKSFTFELETEAQRILARGGITSGELKDKKLKIDIKTGGRTQTKVIPVKDKVYPVTVIPMIAKRGITSRFKKAPMKIEVFDPSIQAVNTATCRLLDSQKDSIKVEISIIGAISTAWIRADGVLLSETQPMGIFIKKEPRDEAIKTGKETPEVLTLFGIPSNIKIDNVRETKFLKLLVKGEFLETDRQKRRGDTLVIEMVGPTTGKSIKECLGHTPFIQSKDKRIIELSRQIVGRTRNSWGKVEKLVNWVSTNIRDMPTVTIPSALDVLETREGDCGEHSILFVALARACKIPAEVVVGLVYTEGGFYYHAWAKVWVGRWVEVDPTFGQSIADATHIALAEGELEEQAKIMELVDKIKIKVIEYH
ncbi:MAG: transglutaminase-like domain-containing protein [Candidatus Thermoplasmatota archaeon]|nr:transglutaminase-like domain-containing protein [Candidatus Thermoplasmatota archaeon]